jgi:hypothetical protein
VGVAGWDFVAVVVRVIVDDNSIWGVSEVVDA